MVLSGSAGDDKLSESGYIVEVEQRRFAHGLDVGCVCEREESKETLRIVAYGTERLKWIFIQVAKTVKESGVVEDQI